MLRPTVKAAEFEKYGFKRCKGIYKDCFYLCVARGSKMLFVSDVCFDVFEWDDVDPRIHKNANHNKDKRLAGSERDDRNFKRRFISENENVR